MKNRRKWKFRKVCLMTLFFGGIGLMLIPPFNLEKGERENKKIVELLKKEQLEKSTSQEEQVAAGQTAEQEEDILGYIVVSRIDIEYAVAEGADSKVLSHFIGHMPETAGIGKIGNCVLAGHRGGRNGVFFLHLDRLLTGDSVKLTDKEGNTYEYVVSEMYVTDAFDSSIKNQGEEEELTLLTCEEKGTKRFVVKCKRKEVFDE